jgi:crAss001_48 related protein
MQPHQQRVVDEKTELDTKLDKLKAFIMDSPIFKTLPVDEQKRLNAQYDVMEQYSKILKERIAAF